VGVQRQAFHRILAAPEFNASYRRAGKLLLGATYHAVHNAGLELGGRVKGGCDVMPRRIAIYSKFGDGLSQPQIAANSAVRVSHCLITKHVCLASVVTL
jgi:hypothetical protein